MLASVLILGVLSAASAQAQAYKPPRTALGAPDLQGLWDTDSMTILQRPKAFKALVATPDEAAAYEAKRLERYAKVIADVDPNAPAPPEDGVEDDDRLDKPRGLARVRGEIRTSQIVSTPDGRLPYTPAAKAAAEKALDNELVYDDPEGRPFDERCILGGGGGVAAPILNRDHIQIVQTRDHVVLAGEQNHEVRIVRMGDRRHLPASVRPWMGDPVGWWEGDTLVVETTNLNPSDHWRWNAGEWIMLTTSAKIVERFARTGPDEILYSYEVDDPGAYTQAWRAETAFHASAARVFEYACHEGNYALANILAGGRQADRDAAKK
ncbi:MAG: hypothetical protein KKE02_20190 [Alphaproteobacteria bacterium]|nr:hypothetical protein [Alphaproteobacteria bacterium]MBU1514794.1 hypothetical protein [Alphaproteobacteria bacterium]MBU2093925.1 hypothetical protein [Alphaproteobacteria bacterium]MBU2153352.1 hypothetical protein [Alphaproteobacteria bacterium]MBU2309780.1 hypothetical protein [Alphaproteobacteria bacterium]